MRCNAMKSQLPVAAQLLANKHTAENGRALTQLADFQWPFFVIPRSNFRLTFLRGVDINFPYHALVKKMDESER